MFPSSITIRCIYLKNCLTSDWVLLLLAVVVLVLKLP